MARIPDSFTQDLLARTDLVELIDSRVPLKKAGRDYAACCPFHNEKSPSFTVSPEKGFYYCFGCGAKGNAIGFLMEYERLGFIEAVEQLANKAGMEVPRDDNFNSEKHRAQKQRNQTLYDLLNRAEQYYCQQLKHAPERQVAVNYLKNRGLSGQVAKRYALGFAPPGFDNLMSHLSLDEKGIELALSGGLLVRKEDSGRTYDKFRDRIIFPIRDGQGRTIGFGGRVLGDGKPKYLNSPETPIFHKGRELYGLWEWRQSKDKSQNLFVVEGYMDVIALAQFDVNNAVATLGTATTEEHAVKLFRQVDEVIYCFDGDKAGLRAAWRALENTLPALEDGKQVRFLFLPDGEDPDTLVREEGREGFLALAAKAPTLSEYFFDHLSEELDLGTVDGRARLARLALPLLEKIKGGAFKRLMQKALAERTKLDLEDLEALRPKQPSPEMRSASPSATQRTQGMPANTRQPAAHASQRTSTPVAGQTADYDQHDGTPPWLQESAPPQHADYQGGYGNEYGHEHDHEHDRGYHEDHDNFVPERDDGSIGGGQHGGPQEKLIIKLIISLIQKPDALAHQPLPEHCELLGEPTMKVLQQLADTVSNSPSLPKGALQGQLMAMDQGSLVTEVMRQSERIKRSDELLLQEWVDGINTLSIAIFERRLQQIEQQQPVDIAEIAGLHKQLAQLRTQQRKSRAD